MLAWAGLSSRSASFVDHFLCLVLYPVEQAPNKVLGGLGSETLTLTLSWSLGVLTEQTLKGPLPSHTEQGLGKV